MNGQATMVLMLFISPMTPEFSAIIIPKTFAML
jgi:hypothetical protein